MAEYEYEFVVSGVDQEQADMLAQIIQQVVEIIGGDIGGLLAHEIVIEEED